MPFISNIGPGELILIGLIVLVVFGPKRLPEVGQALGRGIREFRKAATDVTEATRLDDGAPSAATTPGATATPAAPPASAGPIPAAPGMPPDVATPPATTATPSVPEGERDPNAA